VRRPLALAAVAVALAVPAPSALADTCYGTNVAGACTSARCADPNCFMNEYTVYAYCEHPLPYAWCAAVTVTVP
jgi:hypothetical protein